jgi:uncharacterized protein
VLPKNQLSAAQDAILLRPSVYNLHERLENGSLVVANSLSGAAVIIPPSISDMAIGFLTAADPFVESDLPDALTGLRPAGFFCAASANERRQARLVQTMTAARTDHLELFLLPTEQCDFRCIYCYEDFKLGSMPPAIRAGVIRFLSQRIPKLSSLVLHWFGGEPLQGIDVIRELGPQIRDLAARNDCRFSCHITTNGYSLDEATARELLDSGVTSFQITVDGPREEHDKRRRLRPLGQAEYGTFDQVMKNISSLLSLPRIFTLTIRINYDRDSLPVIPDFVRFLGERFANDPRVRVDFAAIWADPDSVPVSLCMGVEKQRTAIELFELAHSVGLRTDLLDALRPSGLVCYAAKPNSLVIRADGAVNKCTVALSADYNQVGRLAESGELDLNLERLALWTGSGMEEDKVCQSCWFSPSCQGNACPLERIENERRPCPTPKTFGRRMLKLIT